MDKEELAVGIVGCILLLIIISVIIAAEIGLVYWVGSWTLSVFNVEHELTFMQSAAIVAILNILGIFLRGGSKK